MNNETRSFKVGIGLYHGLFAPYLIYFKDTMSVYIYHTRRALIDTTDIFGFLISDDFLFSITVPFNSPDPQNMPDFFLDMTEKIGLPPDRRYVKDVYDTTFWQSRLINSLVMSWVPFFSNCDTYDE
jgi:hypothetical protein